VAFANNTLFMQEYVAIVGDLGMIVTGSGTDRQTIMTV